MAHYAFLDENNVVTEVIAGIDETELIEGLEPEIWYGNFKGQICKRTSYNSWGGQKKDSVTNELLDQPGFRKNYAGIGYSYDQYRDAFIPPKPHPSWILDENTCLWNAPVPYPNDGNLYVWLEEELSWKNSTNI